MNARISLIFLPLALTACGDKLGRGVNGKNFLETFDGPKVESVGDTLLSSAKAAEAEGNAAKAAQYYKQLAEKNPDNVEYKCGLADALRKTNDTETALALYEQALIKDATAPCAQEGKGLVLMQKGDITGAETLLTTAYTKNKTWRSANALGIIYAARNQPEQANTYFLEAQRISPNNPSILNNIALAQALGKNLESSIATFSQALAFSKADSPARKQIELNMALAYATGGKLDEAENIASKYYQGAALNNNMALYAHLAQDDALAKTYLNMALTQSKTFYQRAWNNLETLKSAPADGAPKSLSVPATAPASTGGIVSLLPAREAPVAPVVVTPEEKPVAQPVKAPELAAPPVVEPPKPVEPVTLQPAKLAEPPATALPPTLAMPPAIAQPLATPPSFDTRPQVAPLPPKSKPLPVKKPLNEDSESGFESIGNWVGSILD